MFKLKESFVYQEETNEALHYPSGQEEGNQELIKQLLRQNVKEHAEQLDGKLMENIFENPKETYEYLLRLDREKKKQAILDAHANSYNDQSPLSTMTGIGGIGGLSPSPPSKETNS